MNLNASVSGSASVSEYDEDDFVLDSDYTVSLAWLYLLWHKSMHTFMMLFGRSRLNICAKWKGKGFGLLKPVYFSYIYHPMSQSITTMSFAHQLPFDFLVGVSSKGTHCLFFSSLGTWDRKMILVDGWLLEWPLWMEKLKDLEQQCQLSLKVRWKGEVVDSLQWQSQPHYQNQVTDKWRKHSWNTHSEQSLLTLPWHRINWREMDPSKYQCGRGQIGGRVYLPLPQSLPHCQTQGSPLLETDVPSQYTSGKSSIYHFMDPVTMWSFRARIRSDKRGRKGTLKGGVRVRMGNGGVKQADAPLLQCWPHCHNQALSWSLTSCINGTHK